MPDSPARQRPAVAPPHPPQPFRIDAAVAAQGFIQSRHDISEIAAAPVADHRAGKLFAVALTAPWIGVDHYIPSPGIHLKLVEEVMSILRVRAAVDVQQRRIPLARPEAERLHHPAVELVTIALIAETLRP